MWTGTKWTYFAKVRESIVNCFFLMYRVFPCISPVGGTNSTWDKLGRQRKTEGGHATNVLHLLGSNVKFQKNQIPPPPPPREGQGNSAGGKISKAKTFEGKYEAILALRGGMDNFLTQHNSTQHLLAPFRPHCLMPYAPLRSHMYSQEIKRVLVWWSFHDIFERLTLPQKCFRGVFAEHWIMWSQFFK